MFQGHLATEFATRAMTKLWGSPRSSISADRIGSSKTARK
jgi:hypothetical protein